MTSRRGRLDNVLFAAMWLPRQPRTAGSSGDQTRNRIEASCCDHCRYAIWLVILACSDQIRFPLSPPSNVRGCPGSLFRFQRLPRSPAEGAPTSVSACPAASREWPGLESWKRRQHPARKHATVPLADRSNIPTRTSTGSVAGTTSRPSRIAARLSSDDERVIGHGSHDRREPVIGQHAVEKCSASR